MPGGGRSTSAWPRSAQLPERNSGREGARSYGPLTLCWCKALQPPRSPAGRRIVQLEHGESEVEPTEWPSQAPNTGFVTSRSNCTATPVPSSLSCCRQARRSCCDERINVLLQLLDGGEGSAAKRLPLQDRKPCFDLIEPRRPGRSTRRGCAACHRHEARPQ